MFQESELPQKLSHKPSYSQMDLLTELGESTNLSTRVVVDVRTGRACLSFLNECGDEELRVEHNHRYVDTVDKYRIYNWDGVGLSEPHEDLGLEDAFLKACDLARNRSLNSSF